MLLGNSCHRPRGVAMLTFTDSTCHLVGVWKALSHAARDRAGYPLERSTNLSSTDDITNRSPTRR